MTTSELVKWRGASVPVLSPPEVSRATVQDYLNWIGQGYMGPPPMPTTSYGMRPAEPISNSFEGFTWGMLYQDGPVAAVEAYRLGVFGQAPLLYQEITDGRPGDFFDDDAIDRLRAPWPGGTLSDLAKRGLIHGDLAGNAFVADLDDELVLLRPDWVEIVLEKRMHRGSQVGWRQVGIMYYEGGLGIGDGAPFLPGEYAHFVPGLPDPLASYRGMSWLTPLVREVKADKAAGDHKVAWFENAASVNVAVSLPKEISPAQFKEFVEKMDSQHKGVENAGRTLYTGGGADVTVIGANMQQADFASIVGKGENRIANAGRVPAVLLGFSEGLGGSSLNAGNYTAAKRNFVDTTMRDLWGNFAGSLQQMEAFAPPRPKCRLWYDGRDIPFLHEDAKDLADIQQTRAATISSYITAGFKPDTAVIAVAQDDVTKLEHTGLTSVQLMPPGSQDVDGDGMPDAEAEAADEYQQALDEFRADLEPFWDEIARRQPYRDPAAAEQVSARIDDRDTVEPGQFDDAEIERKYYNVRVAEGHVGGGRFRKIGDIAAEILNDWLDGKGDTDDPLDHFTQPQLKKIAEHHGIKTPPRAGKAALKLAILNDAKARHRDVHEGPKPRASFTLKGAAHRDTDVGLYVERKPNSKIFLRREKDGKPGTILESFDDLDALHSWAEEHGEAELAGWAAKERDGSKPYKDASPSEKAHRDELLALRKRLAVEHHDRLSGPTPEVPSKKETDLHREIADVEARGPVAAPVKKVAKKAPGKLDLDPRDRRTPDAGLVHAYRGLRSSMLHEKDHDFSDATDEDLKDLRGHIQADPRRDRLYDKSIAAIDAELKSRGVPATKRAPAPAKKAAPKAAPDAEEVAQILSSSLSDEGKRRILTNMGVAESEWPESLKPAAKVKPLVPTAQERTAAGYPDVPPGVDVSEDDWLGMSYSERLDAITAARPSGPPAPAKKATKRAPRKAAVPPAEQAARDRQAKIDRADAVHSAVSEVEQLLGDGASDRALKARITSRTVGQPDLRTRLLAAVGDEPAMRKVLADLRDEEGLTPIGSPGAGARFDPELHESIGGDIPLGASVTVVKPGHRFGDVTFPARVEAGDPPVASPGASAEEKARADLAAAEAHLEALRQSGDRSPDWDVRLIQAEDAARLARDKVVPFERAAMTSRQTAQRDADVASYTAALTASGDDGTMDSKILDAVERLRGIPGSTPGGVRWLGLEELRREVGGTREEQDRALRRLIHAPGVRIIPVANTKALTPGDRRAALPSGGSNLNAIGLEPDVGFTRAALQDVRVRRENGEITSLAAGLDLSADQGVLDDVASDLAAGRPREDIARDVREAADRLRGRAAARGDSPQARTERARSDALFALARRLEGEPDQPAARPSAPSGADSAFDRQMAGALSGPAALDAVPLGPRRSASGLSEAQTAALTDYRGVFGYRRVNERLRSGQGADETIREMDAAMASSRLTNDVVVYRGIRDGGHIFGDGFGDDLTGVEWTDEAYQSTFAVETSAENWSRHGLGRDSDKSDPLVIRLLAPAGTGAIELSAIDSDGRGGEMLLARGLRYRVARDHGVVNGARRLDVEVVPSAPSSPTKAAPAESDRQIAEAESRVRTTQQRLTQAQAAFDAAGRDPKTDALGEFFPLGTGGSGGGRRGSTDAQLRRYVDARKARDAAEYQHRRAEARLKELTARRDAAGKYSRDTVSAGDVIKVDGSWRRVQKANAKTVQIDEGPGMEVRYPWARVTDHRPAPSEGPATPAKTARPAKKAAPKVATSDTSTALVDAGDDTSAIAAILAPLNSSQLKDLARTYQIRGASKMRRDQLVTALTETVSRRNLASGAGETIAESAQAAQDLRSLRAMTADARRDSLDPRSLSQLQDLLRLLGLPTSGSKQELLDRLFGGLESGVARAGVLYDEDEESAGEEDDADPDEDDEDLTDDDVGEDLADPTPEEIEEWASVDADAVRAAGHDTHPGGEEFRHYWTETPEGLAKWADSPHPWTALFHHLAKHMAPEMARRVAAQWFHRVFKFWPGSDLNRVTHGRPPRGHRVGPG